MLKKLLKIAVIVIAIAFVAAQFIRPDFTNPPVNEAETLEASVHVPGDVRSILKRSCSDCHTNTTVYPWYSQISPVSWWLRDHINEGREELNFSVWATYQPKRKAKKLEEICEVVREGEMPLASYTWAHGDAVLTKADADMLCAWATAEKEKVQSPPS